MNKAKTKKIIKKTETKTKVVNIKKNKISTINVKKDKSTKKGNSYFGIIFVLLSIIIFFVLSFLLIWLKTNLFAAKDFVELNRLEEENSQILRNSDDPFINIQGETKEKAIKPKNSDSDPILGDNSSKKIKLFYYSDFDCDFCFEQEKIVKSIYEKYKDNLSVVWKDYPNTKDLNSFSYQASRAARCAQAQNSFWQYGDLIYKEKTNFTGHKRNFFLFLAEKINLDLVAFSSCLNSSDVDYLIMESVKEAQNLDVLGVPFISINDKSFLGGVDEDSLISIVESELIK